MLNRIHRNRTELLKIELFICMKMNLALNNLQWLICHKIKPNQIKSYENMKDQDDSHTKSIKR